MVSFPSPFWREKETKETHNHILFVLEKGRKEKNFLQVLCKVVVGWRDEILQNLWDYPDPHCYKKTLEVAPLSEELHLPLDKGLCVTLFHHITYICGFNS